MTLEFLTSYEEMLYRSSVRNDDNSRTDEQKKAHELYNLASKLRDEGFYDGSIEEQVNQCRQKLYHTGHVQEACEFDDIDRQRRIDIQRLVDQVVKCYDQFDTGKPGSTDIRRFMTTNKMDDREYEYAEWYLKEKHISGENEGLEMRKLLLDLKLINYKFNKSPEQK